MAIVLLKAANKIPNIHESVFVAPSADIIGDVEILEGASIWYGAVIRGDVMPIKVGRNSNIQDNCVVHGTYQKAAASIGDNVTVGHGAILHGCTIEDNCLIGMGAMIMDNAVIGKNSLVAAGSLVTENKVYPPGSLIVGRPGVVKREFDEAEQVKLIESAKRYQKYLEMWYDGKKE